MKKFTKTLLFILPIVLAGCSSDDEDSPSPNAAYEGTYEMEDFEVELDLGGSNEKYTIEINPEVELVSDPEMGDEELKLELEEFIKTLWLSIYQIEGFTITANYSIDIEEGAITKISGDKFKVNGFFYSVMVTGEEGEVPIECYFKAEGKFEDAGITMDFSSNGIISFSGTAKGKKW